MSDPARARRLSRYLEAAFLARYRRAVLNHRCVHRGNNVRRREKRSRFMKLTLLARHIMWGNAGAEMKWAYHRDIGIEQMAVIISIIAEMRCVRNIDNKKIVCRH